MATATADTMATNSVVSDDTTMVTSDGVAFDTMVTNGGVSDIFKVTRGFGGFLENTKVNVRKLYMRQIRTGWEANQFVLTNPQDKPGLGRPTGVSNWAIYDHAGSQANLVANGLGMYTNTGIMLNNWFTLVFNVDGRLKGSTLQVMGASADDDEENEWAIVGGTGEFAMARGIIKRRVYSQIDSTLTQELNIEFFCHMMVPAPTMRGPWGGNGGSLREMEGKSQRLESLTINHVGTVQFIEFSYIDENGRIRTSDTWGKIDDNYAKYSKTETIKFGPSELVTQINGTGGSSGSRQYVANFQIVTNEKTYGPFATAYGKGEWSDGTPFSYTVPEGETVVGFFAKTETFINSIGVYTI